MSTDTTFTSKVDLAFSALPCQDTGTGKLQLCQPFPSESRRSDRL